MRISDYLFRSEDIAALVFFRIVFGILAFAEVLGVYIHYGLMNGYFVPESFRFKYYGFQWVEPVPEPFFGFFIFLMLCAAICILLGRFYRVATVFFFFGITYMFLLEKAYYLNHGYFFCWLAFTMIFLPANRSASGDVLNDPALQSDTTPGWTLDVLKFLMGIVYFFGGIAKINADWLNGTPLKIWLPYHSDMPILGPLWAMEETAYFMSYAGLFLDLFIVFLLLYKPTRIFALLMAACFHITNTIVFKIGIFPWLSLAMSVLFFPSDLPRRWWAWAQRFKGLRKFQTWYDRRFSRNDNALLGADFSD